MVRLAARRFVAALAISLCLSGFSADRLAAEPPAQGKPAPPPEQLAELVRQLDADEFLARDSAMLALEKAGPAAISALRPVLAGGSLEATTRALYLLRQL